MPRLLFYMVKMFVPLFIGSSVAFGFGISGQKGRNGSPGRSGLPGESRTIFLNEIFQQVSTEGGRGYDGWDGGRGGDARSCYHGNPNHNVAGARGGNGGNGGTGGRGGNGGDITVYTTSITNLKNLQIIAGGGLGGYGGSAGYGGRGCYCSPPTWTKRTCHNETNGKGETVRKCSDRYYQCHPGSHGASGRHGRGGMGGRDGKMTVYLSEGKPPKPINKIYVDLGKLVQEPYFLSYDVWERRNDARNVLARGSHIKSNYNLWVRQETKNISIKWEAAQNSSDYTDEYLTLIYDDKGFRYHYPRGAYLELRYDKDNETITIIDAEKWANVQKASRVTAGPEEIWLLDGTKNLRKKANDSSFQTMPGSGSRLAISPSGEVWGLDSWSKKIYHFVDNSWQKYTNDRAKRIAVGTEGIWTIDLYNSIWRRDHENKEWISLDDKAKEISIGPNDDIWSIYLNGDVYQRVEEKWEKRGIKAHRISVGEAGIWVVTDKNKIFQYEGDNQWRRQVGRLKDLSVGYSGAIFGITPENFLMEWNGQYFRPTLK